MAMTDSVMKPVRPLAGYHLFFQLEREYLIQNIQSPNESSNDPVCDDRSLGIDIDPDMPARYRNIYLSKTWYESASGKRVKTKESERKRMHRKQHGKISFQELSNHVASRWKTLEETDKETKMYCAKIAKRESDLYKEKVKEYRAALATTQGSITGSVSSDAIASQNPSFTSLSYSRMTSFESNEVDHSKKRKLNIEEPPANKSIDKIIELRMNRSTSAMSDITHFTIPPRPSFQETTTTIDEETSKSMMAKINELRINRGFVPRPSFQERTATDDLNITMPSLGSVDSSPAHVDGIFNNSILKDLAARQEIDTSIGTPSRNSFASTTDNSCALPWFGSGNSQLTGSSLQQIATTGRCENDTAMPRCTFNYGESVGLMNGSTFHLDNSATMPCLYGQGVALTNDDRFKNSIMRDHASSGLMKNWFQDDVSRRDNCRVAVLDVPPEPEDYIPRQHETEQVKFTEDDASMLLKTLF